MPKAPQGFEIERLATMRYWRADVGDDVLRRSGHLDRARDDTRWRDRIAIILHVDDRRLQFFRCCRLIGGRDIASGAHPDDTGAD